MPSIFAIISILVLITVYFFLITEKIDKVIVAVLGGVTLILLQVFRTDAHTSQEGAFHFVSHNLDVLGFVVGIMALVGIVRTSGFFEALAIWLVKKVQGEPVKLMWVLGYLTLGMTALFSNIPTVLILTPIILVLIRQLKLPYFPYFFVMIVMANIGGAMTPISDPTTYYQAKTVGLSFIEVVRNSGLIVMVLSLVSLVYASLIFGKQLSAIKVDPSKVALFKPQSAIKDKAMLRFGIPLLFTTIGLLVSKSLIASATGITLDNASVMIGAAFLAMLVFHKKPHQVFVELVDWDIIFFFIGLFVVVGALEFTHVIELLAQSLVALTNGNDTALTFLITIGSSIISTFIDNVPYNITMVGAIQKMAESGVNVYPLWWALNLGTSIGGFGSPIAAACNVVAFGQAEREKLHTNFVRYLLTAAPLVIINGLITFVIIWLRFLA